MPQIIQLGSGTTFVEVSKTTLANFEIALPPLDEQQRIVAILKEALGDIREGKDALARVSGQMKRFRQSVLAQAFRGELTADWRTEHADRFRRAAEWFDQHIQPNETLGAEQEVSATLLATIPDEIREWLPGDRLLKVILAERRAKWETDQVEKLMAKGAPPKDDNWKGKYSQPASQANIAGQAAQWASASLDQVLCHIRNGLSTPPNSVQGLRILRISAVRPMSVDLSDVRFLEAQSASEYALWEGDLLFTRYNGNANFVGVCGRVRDLSQPTYHPDKLICCRVVPGAVLPGFVEVMVATGDAREWIDSRSKTSAGQTGISGEDLKQTPLPIAPIAEQREIVARIEALFAEADGTEATATAVLVNLRRLEQSTLQAAFQGEL